MMAATDKKIADPRRPMFKNIARKKAYEEVADEIRRLIFERRLKPTHRLPTERDLAGQFGVSRTAVREGIRTLERSGLLQVKKGPKGGLFVAQNYNRPINDSILNLLAGGEASLEDLFEMRLLIEPYAAARSAELATEKDFAALDELIENAEADRKLGNSPRAHNIEFHGHLLRLSGNPVLLVVGEAVLRILADRIQTLVSPATSEKALAMHKLILAALRRRQPQKAAALIAKEIEATGKRLARVSPRTLLRLARDSQGSGMSVTARSN
jgi:GntR family transcriptional repressor for pyruvate dehydrogenase complex